MVWTRRILDTLITITMYIDNAYNAAFAKIFSSFVKNVIRGCQYYCGALPLNLRIDVKRLKFYCNLKAPCNDSVRDLFVLFGEIEFNSLLRKHNLKNTGRVGIWKYCLEQTFNNAVEQLMNNDLT